MIKQDFQDIADFILSDRCTFKGSDYMALTRMLSTLRDAAKDVPLIKEEKDAGNAQENE